MNPMNQIRFIAQESKMLALADPAKRVHNFNVNKWKMYEKIWQSFGHIVPESNIKVHKFLDHLPRVGDLIHVGNNRFKKVIGFNGFPRATCTSTPSSDLFYGNVYVATQFAKRFAHATTEKTGYMRVLVAVDTPHDHHHNEAWYEGNWKPLNQKGIKELNVEAIPLAKYLKV